MSDDDKNKGFDVKDRRVSMEPEESAESEPRGRESEEDIKQEEESAEDGKAAEKQVDLPEITFPTFLLSLNTSALIHMGLIPIPGAEAIEKNLPLAKQTIDLLNLIKQKTQGNLTGEEADLLDNLLFDLKMKYVELNKE